MSYSNFIYQQQTSIVFGKGSVDCMGELLEKAEAKKVMITMGGDSIRKNGVLNQVIGQLDKVGIGYCMYSGCIPNPRSTWVDGGAVVFAGEKCDFIIAVGGGSVIDASKAIAMIVTNPHKDGIWHYISGKGMFESKGIPLGTVLTLAATGSECNGNFVITNSDTGEKLVCSHNWARPIFSICDPEHTYSVNKWQTACGVVDTFSHVLEQYMNNSNTNDVSDGMCMGVLKSLIKWGPIAIAEPDNYDARANLMWASTIGLNGILGAGCEGNWVSHMLEHALSAMFDASHGAGLACIMPFYLQFISDQDTVGKLDHLGYEMFGIDRSDKDIKSKMVRELRGFFKSLGITTTLTELVKSSLTEEDIETMAEKALMGYTMKVGGYKPFSRENAVEVFRCALNGGNQEKSLC